MESEAKLLETLKDWKILQMDLIDLEQKLDSKIYKITTSYSEVKCFSSGMNVSRLENFCLERLELEEKIDSIKKRLKECSEAYRNAGLTDKEKITVRYTIANRSLLQLSRELGIAQAKIYRIRAKAVKKMYLWLQNELK